LKGLLPIELAAHRARRAPNIAHQDRRVDISIEIETETIEIGICGINAVSTSAVINGWMSLIIPRYEAGRL
jgi:hypothetical protein